MNRKILAYKLNLVPTEKVQLPAGALDLTVLDFNGEPTLFAIVNPEELKTETRVVRMVQTGKEFDPKGFAHVGSFPVANYGIVYHFFIDRPDTGAVEQKIPLAPVVSVDVTADSGGNK